MASRETTEFTRSVRAALRARAGRSWSVTAGRGTASTWVTITAPPARLGEYGRMSGDDAAELAQLLGLPQHMVHGGVLVDPAERVEFLDRAEGRHAEHNARRGFPVLDEPAAGAETCPQCDEGVAVDQTYGTAMIPYESVPVQACDDCQVFADDEAAAQALAERWATTYGWAPGVPDDGEPEPPGDWWVARPAGVGDT